MSEIKSTKEKLIFYSLNGDNLKKIHIYEGGVSAGFPSPADDYLDTDLNLHKHLVKHPEATFFVIAKGHSMETAGIHDSDILVVDKSLTPFHNDIVIGIIDGEFSVKRYIKKDGCIFLQAESQTYPYPSIKISEDIDFEIWGVVTHTIHKNR